MNIIHNDSVNSHYIRLLNQLKISDEIVIVSPFLTPDFCTLINNDSLNRLKKISLITTLKPRTPDQICKVSSLYSLIKNYKYLKNLSIYIDNKLHAKVYIFKKNNKYVSGIISSANFTMQGQTTNHETGVEITDSSILKNLESAILNQQGIQKLSIKQIDKMKKDVETFLERNNEPKNAKIKLDLTKYLENQTNFEPLNYWLKPIGHTGHPIKASKIFNQDKEKLHFSRREPTGVKVNDILITYAVGFRKILSVYKVLTKPLFASADQIKKNPDLERWPWYVVGQNLTRIYGANWIKYDLKINPLVQVYQENDFTGILTKVGGKSLGAFNFHLDKINLRKEFAEYIIGRVYQYNNK